MNSIRANEMLRHPEQRASNDTRENRGSMKNPLIGYASGSAIEGSNQSAIIEPIKSFRTQQANLREIL